VGYSVGLCFEVQNGGSDSANSGGARSCSTLAKPATPTVTATSGGSCTVQTYYVVLTYLDSEGETLLSSEQSVTTTSSNKTITVTAPSDTGTPANFILWNIYTGTVSGGPYFWQSTNLITSGNVAIASTPPTSGVQPPGTDYSQSTSPKYSGTNLTVDSSTNTQVLPDSHTVVADDVGNTIITTSGAGFTLSIFEIKGIVSISGTMKWILDRSPAAVNTSGGHWALGGCHASPGYTAGFINSQGQTGNTMFIKYNASAYTASASANVSNGKINQPPCHIHGYNTTRTRFNTDANRPTIQASANSLTILATANDTNVSNLILDGNGHTSITGLQYQSRQYCVNIKANSCANGFTSNTVTPGQCLLDNCEASAFSSKGFNNSGATGIMFKSCVARTTTSSTVGFDSTASDYLEDCIAYSTTTSFTGYNGSGGVNVYSNCIAYQGGANNGGMGFVGPTNVGQTWENCVSYGFQYGFDNGSTAGVVTKCAAGNSGTANWRSQTTASNCIPNSTRLPLGGASSLIVLTADPFTSASGLDFSLNATAGGGSALLALGYPATYGTTSTNNYRDINAAQKTGAQSTAFQPVGRGTFVRGVA
jgi:hypothetical protein